MSTESDATAAIQEARAAAADAIRACVRLEDEVGRLRSRVVAAVNERAILADRARKAEIRLDEIGRDTQIVRGALVKRATVEIPREAWESDCHDLDRLEEMDRRRGWRMLAYALAAVGAANMAAQTAGLMLGGF